MKAVYVIGIDIGTGSTKAVALDVNGEVVATAQQHYPSLPAAPGTDEQDPEVIWEAFVHCINSVIDKAGHAPAIISLSSCMHSLLAVNVDGKPITNMITWADARSQAVAEHLRQSGEAEALYNATGTPLHSMSPLSKIIWFGQKERETFAKAARWISVKEYIWWRLFSAYEVDVSIATASGMMDIHQFCWHEQALKSAGIERQQLSAIVPATYMRSDLQPAAHKLLPLKEETLFCIGSSDGCMANLGSGAVQKGVGALTIGTSAAVRVVTAAPVIHYQSMLFNYPIDEKTFVCGGPVNNGGNMIHWVIKKLKGLEQPNQKDYETFYSELEAVPPGSEGLVCLPYFIGERAPVWDERSSGVFVGVKAHHTQAHFYRAALEGVCFALHQVLQHVEEATGGVQQLRVSGGFIRSGVWLQTLANVTGKKLCIATTEDASATGAALLALEAKGLLKKETTPDGETIEPQAELHAFYQPYFEIYKTLYPSLSDAMHKLYGLQQNVTFSF